LIVRELVIGTRGSALALWQARFIGDVLENQHGCRCRIQIVKTKGDKVQSLSFDKMEGKGFFTKELEDALLAGEIDLAVHSLKDVMTTQPDGLAIGAVGFRADRRELLLVRRESFADGKLLPVKEGAVIGTSSARRKCQIAYHLPSAEIRDLRGNVPTRVEKLRSGEYDAIIVAAAGVERMKLDVSDLAAVFLPLDEFLPAPAQGVLGIEIREGDSQTAQVVSKLNCPQTAREVLVERGLLARFEAGCSLPLGVFCNVTADVVKLTAVLGEHDGTGWTGLRRVMITGDDSDQVIEQAYRELTGER
jgi:hydroxymethylbilane synthase